MARRQTLADFSEETITVPEFAQGSFGMDLVIRDGMDDAEWRRWNALIQTGEMKQMMGQFKRTSGIHGLRNAIIQFLTDKNIKVKGQDNA